MHKFFIPPHQLGEDKATITGEDSRHITKSLRMKNGEKLLLSVEDGREFLAEITSLSAEMVQVSILDCWPDPSESSLELTLYQALPKGDKLEQIVQQATQLGVKRIVPILTQCCVSRPKEKAMAGKIQRLERIALEAAKQSRRGRVPEISHLMSYKEGLEDLMRQESRLLYYEKGAKSVKEYLPLGKKVGIMIGSEGGFAPEEIQAATALGVSIVQLGQRILRCETAPIVALSTLLYIQGEL